MERRSKTLTRQVVGLEEYGVLDATVPPQGLRAGAPDQDDVSHIADERFAAAINERLSKSSRKNISIYVHGFNAWMAGNLGIVAQLHYYLGLDGVMISYGWPSQRQLFGGYHADKANARFTVRHFRLLLNFLAAHTDAEQINILAHSAGAPVVVDALRQIRFIHDDAKPADVQRRSKIGLVILGAPDGDLDWFVNACLDGWMQVAKSVHVYASKADRALKISGDIYEAPRTGAAVGHLRRENLEALRTQGNLWLIDVTPARHYNKLLSGHSYHHMNAWVSSDGLLAIKFGVPPDQRGLVRSPDGVFWTFPEDYVERVRPIAQALYGSE